MQERNEPIRTVFPARVGFGVAQVDGVLHGMLTVDDDETGGVIDVIMDKALLGELIAHADDVRRRVESEGVLQP